MRSSEETPSQLLCSSERRIWLLILEDCVGAAALVRSRVVQSAASTRIALLDSPYFNIEDTEGLKQETKASASLGFHGKCAIHPGQIATINEVLMPSEQQVVQARQILVVPQKGVGSLDHQMVDEAVARKARLVLERAGIAAEK
jgi:(S)-citramalyl-CoA lyase